MIPFMTEDIYQNLVRKVDASARESIHLCDFPTVDESQIDKELEKDMDEVLRSSLWGVPAEIPPISRTVSPL